MEESRQALNALHRKLERKKHLEKVLPTLKHRRDTLEKEVRELRLIMKIEQWEANRLERISLWSLFYEIMGNRKEVYQKEEKEAALTRMKYEAMHRESVALEQEIATSEQELDALQDCRTQYDELLERVLQEIRKEDSEQARTLLKIEQKLIKYEQELAELDRAIASGTIAVNAVNRMLRDLDTAENWSHMEQNGDGNLLDFVKYSKLNDAEYEIDLLRSSLRRMKTDLADVEVAADISTLVDRENRFYDMVYDTPWYNHRVQDRIVKVRGEVKSSHAQLNEAMKRLHARREDVERKLDKQQKKLNAYVVNLK